MGFAVGCALRDRWGRSRGRSRGRCQVQYDVDLEFRQGLSIADCLREHIRQLRRLIEPCRAPNVDVISKEELFDRSCPLVGSRVSGQSVRHRPIS
jgi:hypothetical protein